MPFLPELRNVATWCAIALGFAIPLSTGASNVLFAVTAVLFLISGAYREKFAAIARNPVALAALGLCALVLLGCAYGGGNWVDKKHYLVKYLALLGIPLLVPLFQSRASRIQALWAFVAAMLLTLALSCLSWLDFLPLAFRMKLDEGRDLALTGAHNAIVFKLSITHGFLMAITAYLLAQAARQADSARWRRTLGGLAALAAVNVLVMVLGRTGYVALGLLGIYFFACRFGRRGMALAAVACVLAGAAAYQWSEAFHTRISDAVSEATHWQPGKDDPSSIGTRLNYYANTLSIIKQHPWSGVGTGGFETAYAEQIKNSAMEPSNNPHNQYLLFAAQYGIFGLAALLGMFALYWRQAGRLAPPFQEIARAVLLAFIAGNLFNSFMLDFSERMFFAWISGVLLAGLSDDAA